MIPPSKKMEYEKVKTDDFVTGEIKEIKYDMEHKFTYEGNSKVAPACRIVFKVDGYTYDHGTGWMSFTLSKKSNLYKKYIAQLVKGAEPDMEFDLDQLIGMKVKILWIDRGDWQHVDNIRPVGDKIEPVKIKENSDDEIVDDEKIPF